MSFISGIAAAKCEIDVNQKFWCLLFDSDFGNQYPFFHIPLFQVITITAAIYDDKVLGSTQCDLEVMPGILIQVDALTAVCPEQSEVGQPKWYCIVCHQHQERIVAKRQECLATQGMSFHNGNPVW